MITDVLDRLHVLFTGYMSQCFLCHRLVHGEIRSWLSVELNIGLLVCVNQDRHLATFHRQDPPWHFRNIQDNWHLTGNGDTGTEQVKDPL